MSDLRTILKKPLVTEKGTWLQEKNNQYSFLVDKKANRAQIRRAVKVLYPEIDVVKVCTLIRKGKPRRSWGRPHRTPATKKAIVTLKRGQSIELS